MNQSEPHAHLPSKASLPQAYQAGIEALAKGKWEAAIAYLHQALALEPQRPEIHNALGVVFQQQGRVTEAQQAFESSLAINPLQTSAIINLALLYKASGQSQQALDVMHHALRQADNDAALKQSPLFWSTLGEIHLLLKQPGPAFQAFHQALPLNPHWTGALHGLGLLYLQNQCYNLAAYYLTQAVEQTRPEAMPPERLVHLTQALRGLGKNQLADQLLELEGNRRYQIGYDLYQSGQITQALPHFEATLTLVPLHANALNMRGNVALKHGLWDQAINDFTQALALSPNDPSFYCNRGLAYRQTGQYLLAQSDFEQALLCCPNHPPAQFAMGMIDLLHQRFEAGWQRYESRKATPGYCGLILSEPPPWQGEPLAGKTVFVHAEQGYGDTLQFVRYLPLLKAAGCHHLIFCCDPCLAELLGPAPGVDQFVSQPSPPPGVDYQIALMSLPLVLKSTIETLPNTTPYLTANPRLQQQWREWLNTNSPQAQRRIGLVWQGRPTHPDDHNRSCPLSCFETLLQTFPENTFVSLQVGPPTPTVASQLADYSLLWPITPSHGFEDTAALITQLDLVISVDTAVVHLAGALNQPVWTLLSYDPDWRWFLNSSNSPWYPSMTLFRQPQPGDWIGLMSQVRAALKNGSSTL